MKKLMLLTLLALTTSAFAYYNPFENVSSENCRGLRVDSRRDIAYCNVQGADQILKARVGGALSTQEAQRLGFYLLSPIDLDIVPDADTNQVYNYNRWLLDARGNKIGVLSIDGWENSEMRTAGRVDTRYNLKGQIVSIELKPIR